MIFVPSEYMKQMTQKHLDFLIVTKALSSEGWGGILCSSLITPRILLRNHAITQLFFLGKYYLFFYLSITISKEITLSKLHILLSYVITKAKMTRERIKGGTHEGLVPATSPSNYSLEEFTRRGNGRRDYSHKQFTRSFLRRKSQGLVPKIQTMEKFKPLWD